jgi:hypothetical protein
MKTNVINHHGHCRNPFDLLGRVFFLSLLALTRHDQFDLWMMQFFGHLRFLVSFLHSCLRRCNSFHDMCLDNSFDFVMWIAHNCDVVMRIAHHLSYRSSTVLLPFEEGAFLLLIHHRRFLGRDRLPFDFDIFYFYLKLILLVDNMIVHIHPDECFDRRFVFVDIDLYWSFSCVYLLTLRKSQSASKISLVFIKWRFWQLTISFIVMNLFCFRCWVDGGLSSLVWIWSWLIKMRSMLSQMIMCAFDFCRYIWFGGVFHP